MRELVVGLVFAVGVEVEDALNEVLAEHLRVLLEQQVEQAVFTQTETGNKNNFICATATLKIALAHQLQVMPDYIK